VNVVLGLFCDGQQWRLFGWRQREEKVGEEEQKQVCFGWFSGGVEEVVLEWGFGGGREGEAVGNRIEKYFRISSLFGIFTTPYFLT